MIIIVTIDAIIINSSLNITRFIRFFFNGESEGFSSFSSIKTLKYESK